MRTRFTSTLIALCLYASSIYAYDPPKELHWNVPFDSARFILASISKLSAKDPNQNNVNKAYREYIELVLPE